MYPRTRSTAMPHGELNWPSPFPREPNFMRKLPSFPSNFWTRWLFVSTTYTSPFASHAMPIGLWKFPFAVPKHPQRMMKLPLLSNFWTRLLPLSTMKGHPCWSTAIPYNGLMNSPPCSNEAPRPGLPHFAMHRYPDVLTRMVALAGTETLLPTSLNQTYIVLLPSPGESVKGTVAPNLYAGVTSIHPGTLAVGAIGLSEMK